VQFIQGRLYEQAAYYQWADGVIGLASGEPLGINSNETAFVTPTCSPLKADRQCRAQNSVLAFGAYVCDDVFENVQLHPPVSGMHVGCVIPRREQAYGQLGLADIALDEYQGLLQSCQQPDAGEQLELAAARITTANDDVKNLAQGPAVVTIRAMRAKVLEEQGALAERLGRDPAQYRRDALAQWRRVTNTSDLGDQDRDEVHRHIDILARLQLADDLNAVRLPHSSNAIVAAKRFSGDALSFLIGDSPLRIIHRLFPSNPPQDYGLGRSMPECSPSAEQLH
jgi:hypothetical protein